MELLYAMKGYSRFNMEGYLADSSWKNNESTDSRWKDNAFQDGIRYFVEKQSCDLDIMRNEKAKGPMQSHVKSVVSIVSIV